MDPREYIRITEFCSCYKIDRSFIRSLNEYGLVEITILEETEFLDSDQVKKAETMARLHYDLDINLEGIDAISHLLHKVSNLQAEVRLLKNKLRRYEE